MCQSCTWGDLAIGQMKEVRILRVSIRKVLYPAGDPGIDDRRNRTWFSIYRRAYAGYQNGTCSCGFCCHCISYDAFTRAGR